MTQVIHSIVPAELGWLAFYNGEFEEDAASARIVARALVESDDGEHDVGLVIADGDPTQIVTAPEGASAVATEYERYGFRAD